MSTPLSTCLVLSTIRAARALTRRYDARLREHGVTLAQFSVMGSIREQAERTLSEHAERIAMDRTTLSRNLDLLERKGLARKTSGAGNARRCALTPAGEALLDRLMPLWAEAQDEIRARLGDADPDAFLHMLDLLTRP
ncbi:MarR family winged helix-turn-helix transcriptional regulator [Albimonas sp. CAU 1670]|uniref:MarR family winged helix-turn-helix transcriptional regulator n=1 Tax=Albimonas sp. CAU 1670 TaxID=3032599 RepID=UPI0023DC13C8|nr:MarR family winged helix-turn-helix transcriptional regulator [Albimonas sp. CAU 1670]MDF2232937.1 MarR family winged helix-turn-helix transcriptional regulator [Albimonas sp. CAU 1670]